MSSAISAYLSNISTRKAFAIHLTLSLLIFSSLVFVMLMWWFPGELFFLDGGWQGLKIVALIDLVLGPLLTLVLYKPGKPSLVFDMSFVAAFQIIALAYGFYATHEQRTVAIVYADRNFTTLSANTALIAKTELIDLELRPQQIRDLDRAYPALLITPEPEGKDFGKYVSQLLSGYPESHERLDLFQKLEVSQHREILEKRVKSQEELEITGANVLVDNAMAKGNYDIDDTEVHHFKARYAQGLVLFSKSKNEILDYIPIDWDALIAENTPEETLEVNPEVLAESAEENPEALTESTEENLEELAESAEE